MRTLTASLIHIVIAVHQIFDWRRVILIIDVRMQRIFSSLLLLIAPLAGNTQQRGIGELQSQQLFTYTALTTYGSLAAAVIAVTNGLRMAFGWSPKWLGLVVSQVICIGVALAISARQWSDVFLATLNAFLVYGLAAGGNAVATAASVSIGTPSTSNTQPLDGGSPNKKQFFMTWY